MDENLKRLQKDIKKLDSYRVITTDELSSFLNDVANVLAQYRSATATINTETRDTLNLIVKRVQEEHDKIVEETSNENQTHRKEMYDCLSQMESILEKALSLNYTDGKDGADGKDGQDGKDADEEKIIEEVLKKIVVPEVDLEPLKEDIESKFSKVYDHIKKSINGFPGVRLLSSLIDVVLSSPTNGQALVYDSTLGKWKNGTVSGSGSPGGSDTEVQFNDGGSFGGDPHFTYDKTNDVLRVHKIAGDATDGLIIESANGTDVGLLGPANTANVTWYGSHNYNTVTASRVAQFGASKTLESSTVTTTELGYVSGVTSAIQTQIDAKAPQVGASDIEITDTTKGLILKSPDGTRWRLGITNNGELTATSL